MGYSFSRQRSRVSEGLRTASSFMLPGADEHVGKDIVPAVDQVAAGGAVGGVGELGHGRRRATLGISGADQQVGVAVILEAAMWASGRRWFAGG